MSSAVRIDVLDSLLHIHTRYGIDPDDQHDGPLPSAPARVANQLGGIE